MTVYSQRYFDAMNRQRDAINRIKASGKCPICGNPAKRMTCGSAKCVNDWIVWGKPAPQGAKAGVTGRREHRQHRRAYGAVSYMHEDADPLAAGGPKAAARVVTEETQLVEQGDRTLFDQEQGELEYA